ncbi:MAG: hypothetical protein MMC33_010448 [Icmadophila ericetorum]|nr:hypothetical protein [Icmadophila ericetorum]
MASPQLVETGGASFEVSLSDGMQALLVEIPGELTVVSDPNRKIESSGVTDTSPESDPIHDVRPDIGWLDEDYVPKYKYLPEGVKVPSTADETYQLVDIHHSLGVDSTYSDRGLLLEKLIKRRRGLFSDTPGLVWEPEEN